MKQIILGCTLALLNAAFAAGPVGWTDDASTWKLIQRSDRANKLESGRLSGMMIGKRMPVVERQGYQITVKARGKGRFKAYFFQYESAKTEQIDVGAWVIDDELTDAVKEYVACVEVCGYHSPTHAAIAIDGADIEVISASAEPVKQGAKAAETPRVVMTIPELAESPKWDGVFRENFWRQNGVTFRNGLRDDYSSRVNPCQCDVFFMADRENLYIACAYLIPPGGISNSQTAHDSPVYKDEAVELWVNPVDDEPPADLYQMIANLKGTLFDQDHQLSIGQIHLNWMCKGFTCQSGRREKWNGKTEAIWLVKMPFASVGIQDPYVPFGLVFGRDFTNPHGGASLHGASWSDPKKMMRCRIAKGAPAVELKLNEPVGDGRYKVDLNVIGAAKGVATIASGDLGRTNKVELAGDASVTLDATDRKIFLGAFDATVTAADGSVLFADRLSVETANYTPREARTAQAGEKDNVTVEYHPFSKRVNLRWPNSTAAERAALAKAEVAVTYPSGKNTALTDYKVIAYEGLVNLVFDAALDEEGEYKLVAKVFGKDGKVLAGGKRAIPVKKLEWVGNDLGKADIVVKPFTAMKVEGDAVSCILRKHVFGANGLLKGVEAANGDVLAAPMEFIVETAASSMPPDQGTAGRARSTIAPLVTSTFQITKASDTRVEFTAENRYDGLKIVLEGWMEYDGFLWYTMKLVPEKPIALKRLAMRVPYRKPTLFHCTTGSIRRGRNYYELAKDFPVSKDPLVWSMEGKGNEKLKSTFVPFFWLGDNRRGLMWFAENDKGWVNSKTSSGFDLRRGEDGTYAMDVNFVSIPTTLAKTREIKFGFVANPVKPTRVGCGEWHKFDSTFGMGIMNAGAEALDPWVTDKMMDASKNRPSRLLYLAGEEYIQGDSEVKYFIDDFAHWPRAYYTLELNSKKYLYRGPASDNYLSVQFDWSDEATDFFVWRMAKLLNETRMDGFYLDNTYPYYAYDPIKPSTPGYIRDDGSVQPGTSVLAVRDLFKRVAVLREQLGTKLFPGFLVHLTGAHYLPRVTFADSCSSAEMDIPKGKDHFDVFYSPWVETMAGVDWGMALGMAPQLGSYNVDAADKLRRTRAMYACYRIYDYWIWDNGMDETVHRAFAKIDRDFGIAEPNCKFTLWRFNDFVKFANAQADVRVSYYERPGKKLLYMANHEKTPQTVAFTLAKEGTLTDAETGKAIAPAADGSYSLAIPGHDLRVLLWKK